MDHYQLIADSFQDTIETIAMSVDTLAEPLRHASEMMAGCLLGDRKILACGNGADAALAQLFCSRLLDRLERERPALPAMALGADGASLTAIAADNGFDDIFSRQLRALGQSGDVLLCINSGPRRDNLERAVQAAHERNMAVVALSNPDDGELALLLRAGDAHLAAGGVSRPRITELQVMVLHCLCALIDRQIFGNGGND